MMNFRMRETITDFPAEGVNALRALLTAVFAKLLGVNFSVVLENV